jgi:hypothetical protein
MTKFQRLFAWTGGALFVASLATVAWWFTWPLGAAELGRTGQISLPALGADALVFSVFALHHSLFARARVKVALASVVPDTLQRSLFVWIASLLLIGVTIGWRPIGGVIYLAPEWIAAALLSVQLAGAWLIVESVRAIDALELAGIRSASATAELQVKGPYDLVRHPLYLGWMLLLFGAAHMTADRLAFAAISSLYLVVAMPWEERSLERTFGPAYGRYKEQVRWRVLPGVY